MKKIVGIISEIETLSYFSKQLLTCFRNEGHKVHFVSMESMQNETLMGKEKELLWEFIEENNTVLLTFNFVGLSEEACFFYDNTHTIWEEKKVLIYNILVDHPLYYAAQLEKKQLHYHLFCLDSYHVSFVKRFYSHIPVDFMALAGNELLFDLDDIKREELQKEKLLKEVVQTEESQQSKIMIPYENRSNPLTFIGNYPVLTPLDEVLKNQPKEYQDFYQNIFEQGIKKRERSIEFILEEALKQELVTSLDDLKKGMQATIFLDIYMRAYDRKKVVSHILDENIPIFLVGKDWDVFLDERKEKGYKTSSNVKISSRMLTSKDCIKILADTQMSLNIMPGFKAGSHDRIYSSMLQECVVLTDRSEYLCDNLVDEDTLCFYDVMNLSTLSSQITALLNSKVKATEIARRGYIYAKKNHTWTNRAKFLSDFFVK